MRDYKSLAHTKWDCKYHVVFIPKYRKKVIYGKLRGKSAIMIARKFGKKARDFKGESFWARGYFVSKTSLTQGAVG